MAIKTIDDLIGALSKKEVAEEQSNKPGLLERNLPLWIKLTRRAVELYRQIMRAPGVDGLLLICEAEDEDFTCKWVRTKRARLAQSIGVTRSSVGEVGIQAFMDLLAGKKRTVAKRGRKPGSKNKNSKKAIIIKALEGGEFPNSVAKANGAALSTVKRYDRLRRANKVATKPRRGRK